MVEDAAPVAIPLPAMMMPGPAVSLSRLESSTLLQREKCRGAKGRLPPVSTRLSSASCSSGWAA